MKLMSGFASLFRAGFTPLIVAWLALCATSVIGEHLSHQQESLRPVMDVKTAHAAFEAASGPIVAS